MSDWTTEYLTMVEDCEARVDRLDEWSQNFIQSIREQLEAEKMLSPRQVEKLEEVWERATKNG